MEFAVVGGDRRFAYLTRLLCACGRDARAVDGMACDVPNVPTAEEEMLAQAENVVINWPAARGEEVLRRLRAGTRVYFCGPRSPEGVPASLRAVDLWRDEQLLLENAWLTAEGAISAAMNAGNASLKDCHCLIVGWGRIGRALTELLIGMSAHVTVASRSEKGRNGAVERGAEGVSTWDLPAALRGKQIVFSTPPVPVLGREELEHAEKDALILDLASAPYGVNLKAAEALGLRAWREPGLPGRYCPYSAARALLQGILRAEMEDAE